MSILDTDKTPVLGHDALSCFSYDEWKVLQEWQTELCGNLMKEIHQALISLGPLITSTIFSLRVKGKQQMPSVDSQESERRPLVNGFPSDSITNPGELFCNMKGEQNVCLSDPQETEERENLDCLSREDEPATIFIDQLGAEVKESNTKTNSGVPLITAVFSLSTNPEEETCAQEKTEAEKGTSDSGSIFVKESSTCYESPKNSTCPAIIDLCQVVQIDKLTLFTDGKNAFKRDRNHLQHQKFHKGKKAFPCSDCWKSFSQKSDLHRHQRIHTGEKPYSCNECEKRFTQQAGLKRHQRFHSGEKPFPCSECEKSFVYRSDFERHQRIHKRENMYNCTECEKSFIHMSTLQRHQRIHNDEKSFSCTDCEKSFVQKSDFLNHQRIHMGEKPIQCTECEKSFSYKSDFQRHQRRHTGEKPFPCTECGKCFTRKAALQHHQNSHKGVKTFPCNQCEKSFNQYITLKRHQILHAGEKPYLCTRCDKSFMCRTDLQFHQRVHVDDKPFSCT